MTHQPKKHMQSQNQITESPATQEKKIVYIPLANAILELQTPTDVDQFFIDLFSPKERESFDERWKIAQLLYTKEYSYREISEIINCSTTTVGRVAKYLQDNNSKYRKILDQLTKENIIPKG